MSENLDVIAPQCNPPEFQFHILLGWVRYSHNSTGHWLLSSLLCVLMLLTCILYNKREYMQVFEANSLMLATLIGHSHMPWAQNGRMIDPLLQIPVRYITLNIKTWPSQHLQMNLLISRLWQRLMIMGTLVIYTTREAMCRYLKQNHSDCYTIDHPHMLWAQNPSLVDPLLQIPEVVHNLESGTKFAFSRI